MDNQLSKLFQQHSTTARQGVCVSAFPSKRASEDLGKLHKLNAYDKHETL